MSDSDHIDRLEQIIAHLIEINQEIPVIVEGPQDVRCLTELGLKGAILKVHNGKSLYEFCEELSSQFSGVVLLMDWDRRGDQIHEQLARDLGASWSRYDHFRKDLKRLCYPDIQEVEHLARYLQNLKNLQEREVSEDPEC